MTPEHDLRQLARSIIDKHRYMTLATADASGLPWVSPVWYAPKDHRELFWVSSPDARHSRNLAARPQLAIVIFDTHLTGGWEALYMSAVAEEVADVEEGVALFSRHSEAQGLRRWTLEDVLPPARHRVYRATASEHFVLDALDRRQPVTFPDPGGNPIVPATESRPAQAKQPHMIESLDHLVLTVSDIEATVAFYESLGMQREVFGGGRVALRFGRQKLNLHLAGREIEPHARRPMPGSADLCFLVERPIEAIVDELAAQCIELELGPVDRAGAWTTLRSVYLRDPDGNLVELSEPR